MESAVLLLLLHLRLGSILLVSVLIDLRVSHVWCSTHFDCNLGDIWKVACQLNEWKNIWIVLEKEKKTMELWQIKSVWHVDAIVLVGSGTRDTSWPRSLQLDALPHPTSILLTCLKVLGKQHDQLASLSTPATLCGKLFRGGDFDRDRVLVTWLTYDPLSSICEKSAYLSTHLAKVLCCPNFADLSYMHGKVCLMKEGYH